MLFNCPEVSPTIEQIDHSFGATHPGVYDDEKNVFTLTFRGLAFEFPADTKFQVGTQSASWVLATIYLTLTIFCSSRAMTASSRSWDGSSSLPGSPRASPG